MKAIKVCTDSKKKGEMKRRRDRERHRDWMEECQRCFASKLFAELQICWAPVTACVCSRAHDTVHVYVWGECQPHTHASGHVYVRLIHCFIVVCVCACVCVCVCIHSQVIFTPPFKFCLRMQKRRKWVSSHFCSEQASFLLFKPISPAALLPLSATLYSHDASALPSLLGDTSMEWSPHQF